MVIKEEARGWWEVHLETIPVAVEGPGYSLIECFHWHVLPPQCDRKGEFFDKIQQLDIETQAGIKAHIRKVGVWLALWGLAMDSCGNHEADSHHQGEV